MKVIFLDFDGVLNSAQSATFWHNKRDQKKWENEMYSSWQGTLKEYLAQEFCPIALSNVEELMRRVPELKIVVSSTWRLGETVDTLKAILSPAPLVSAAIVSVTPSIRGENGHSVPRGSEIQYWLDRHPEVTEFAIIDDDSDMVHLSHKLIQTSDLHGYQYKDILRTVKLLNGENDESK